MDERIDGDRRYCSDQGSRGGQMHHAKVYEGQYCSDTTCSMFRYIERIDRNSTNDKVGELSIANKKNDKT